MTRRSPKQTYSLIAILAVLLIGMVLVMLTAWNPLSILVGVNQPGYIPYIWI